MEALSRAVNDDISPIKFTIEKETFLKSLARVQSIVEKRNTIPILSNIKIDTANGQISLTSTDMELVANESISANIENEGSLTVPAQTLYDIIRKLPDGAEIQFDTDIESSQVIIETENTRFKLPFLPSNDFPIMSEGEPDYVFTLPSDILLTLIKKASFAMSVKETRYYLNGVFIHEENNDANNPKLCSVTTDGHRLALLAIALPAEAVGMPGIILPKKTVNEICRILEEQDSDTEISISNGKVKFAVGNIVLLSKLVDANFPEYSKAIPENNDIKMEVNTDNLRRAVDRVSTISSDKTKAIKFIIENGKLTLSAQNIETGTSKEELDILFDSDKIEIGINSKYILDLLDQIDGDTTQFLLANANSSILISDPSDIRAQYVIMPMRV